MNKKSIALVGSALLFAVVGRVGAADEKLVREYMAKAEFRNGIEMAIRGLNPNAGKSSSFSAFVGNINFAAIEDAYARALINKLTNLEVEALIKAIEIPGIKEAIKKQTQAATDVYQEITKEIEAAAAKAGMQPRIPDSGY